MILMRVSTIGRMTHPASTTGFTVLLLDGMERHQTTVGRGLVVTEAAVVQKDGNKTTGRI